MGRSCIKVFLYSTYHICSPGICFLQVEEFKSRAITNEVRAARLDYRAAELSRKVKAMESELSKIGVAKEGIESFLFIYKLELEQASSRASELEEHLSHEQETSASLRSKLHTIRRADANAGHARMLEERISELDRSLEAVEEEVGALDFDKKQSCLKRDLLRRRGRLRLGRSGAFVRREQVWWITLPPLREEWRAHSLRSMRKMHW